MKKGDTVIYTSGFHGSHSNNPLHSDYPEVIGIITKVERSSSFPIYVRWSTGRTNCYNINDLSTAEDLDLIAPIKIPKKSCFLGF